MAGQSGSIESRSIDYVPASERHGTVAAQARFWFLGNFQPFTLFLGVNGVVLFGLPLVWAIVGGILGILFGTLFMAFHASQGPQLGLPQMVQSRAQFGYRGVVIPLFATLFTFMAFNVADVVVIKEGVFGIFGWSTLAVAIAITVIATLLAIYGHDWLHRAFTILFFLSVPFVAVFTIGMLLGRAEGGTPAEGLSFTVAGFVAQMTTAAAYNVTYAPYVSDYSRYLPKDTSTSSIIRSVFAGASGSPIWLIPVGAWLAASFGAGDPIVGLYQAGNSMLSGLGSVVTLLAILALVATMGINAYSAMLTVVTGLDAVVPIRPTRMLRVVIILVLATVWLVLGLALTDAVLTIFIALTLMLYLLTPWTAVNLVDYFVVRRGHYAITDLFTPRGIYGAWNRQGLIGYFVGIVAMLPFINLPFTESVVVKGFMVDRLGGVDIAFVVGLVVSALVYVLVMRGVDLRQEQPAVEASERVIAELDAQTGVDTVAAVRAS